MADKLSMQDIILTLQQFWAKQGCMLMQSYEQNRLSFRQNERFKKIGLGEKRRAQSGIGG